ncbi:hypothetical protein PoB_007535400 [Plakobranchus ocellatus]|uniref:Uncharacterized protein n=1 Tax=Plakobranchus ocellatus TaxID=259542 RepID=A0AAV4DXA0_9GAST|nr:hypothetical protein PoB_007535400 [Plakobranchus ocellatus]
MSSAVNILRIFLRQVMHRRENQDLASRRQKVKDGFYHPAELEQRLQSMRTSETNKRRSLVRTIRKRQATFLGHVMGREKLDHLVTTGKFEGKRNRGRQREKIMDGLATWLGTGKVSDILAAVKGRDLWRDIIANAYKQGT